MGRAGLGRGIGCRGTPDTFDMIDRKVPIATLWLRVQE